MSWILRVAAFAAILAPICASAGPLADQVTADPFTPQWLFRPNGTPIFMCGPGDPEGFLYRGTRNSDGTRSGDQMSLIGTMAGTGANCLYLIAVRSHGGDGDATENPFVNSDPAQGLDQDILDQWDTWFTAMDDAGIIIYFFFYDDSATIWNTGDSVGNEERTFVQTLVNRFEGHANLIWCVAEEYSEAFSIPRISNLAAEIRAADDYDHVIAVHQRSGTDFDFPSDPNIDQFAIQFNVATAGALHTGMLWAWDSANGQYQLNMSEAAAYGTGATARQKSWAVAMGGAYVMILGMDVATTAISDLEDCGRLVSFMESTNFHEMAPHDELGDLGTRYVLADPGKSYIAYSPDLVTPMGLNAMTAGSYDFLWFDCITGQTVEQLSVAVGNGDQSWSKPNGFGPEVALYLTRSNPTPVQPDSWAAVKARFR